LTDFDTDLHGLHGFLLTILTDFDTDLHGLHGFFFLNKKRRRRNNPCNP